MPVQPVVLLCVGEGGAPFWDSEGPRVTLDFLAGIAVVGVGHCHPRIAEADCKTGRKPLMHVSKPVSTIRSRPSWRSGLCGLARMDKAFFCNSGTEANEAALKIARKWGKKRRGDDLFRDHLVQAARSMGGPMGAASPPTAQPKYQAAFAPLVPGFRLLRL